MPGLISVDGVKYFTLEAGQVLKEGLQCLPASNQVSAVTLHWTAGNYNQGFNDYQILISDSQVWISKRFLDWHLHQHTWRRNTGNVAISLMAMAPDAPVTRGMIERAAAAIGLVRKRYGLSDDQVRDHGFYAKLDGYWPDRVDVQIGRVRWEENQPLDRVLKRKGAWYLDTLNKLEQEARA